MPISSSTVHGFKPAVFDLHQSAAPLGAIRRSGRKANGNPLFDGDRGLGFRVGCRVDRL
jgi:hypothetical protein